MRVIPLVLMVVVLGACVTVRSAAAQSPAVSPLAPICPEGSAPTRSDGEFPVVIRAGTAWNRHEYSAEERARILYHADAIRQHFTPPSSLGDPPVLAETWIRAWGGAPTLHSAVGAKLVMVMKANGHVRSTFWQMVPFSTPLATAVTDAVAAADKAGDFEGIPRAGEARGDDTLVVQLRSITTAAGADELPLMRARLSRYVVDEPASIIKQGSMYYPPNAGDSGVENRGEIIALVGSDGKPIMPGTQISRIEWRDFINTMRRAIETTVYQPARSGGCAVPSLFPHSFNFTVRR